MGFLRYATADLGDLIAEAQSGRGDRALQEILRRFDRLVRKLGRIWGSSMAWREDVENAARFGLTQAVARHRGSADTFPGYAKVYMIGEAKREAAHWVGPDDWSLVDLDAIPTLDQTNLTPVEVAVDGGGWGFGDAADAIADLRPDQRHLLSRRYRDGAELREIADECSCSIPAVSQRLSTVHRRLASALAA